MSSRLPFAIVATLLEQFLTLSESLSQYRLQREVQRSIQQRVVSLVHHLRENNECICGRALSSDSLSQLEYVLHRYLVEQADRRSDPVQEIDSTLPLPNLRETEIAVLHEHLRQAMMCEDLPRLAAELRRLQSQIADVQQELEEKGDLSDQGKTLVELQAIVGELREKKGSYEKEMSILKQNVEKDIPNQLQAIESQMQQVRSEMIKSDRARRAEKLASKTIDLIEELLQVTRKRKIEALQNHVTETLRRLWSKRELLEHVEVNPNTFAVAILQRDGTKLDKQSLSAGEKELFALSLLAGLCKCASSDLPVVIDTPLARLDSEHREHIVRSYYPHVAPQVILLSTDTEVTSDLFKALLPYIRQTFTLEHDAGSESTRVKNGFFDRAA